jgi:hemin uptake protein HemP
MSALPQPPRLSLESLLKGAREVIILHAGQEYRLRLTSTNKLILTK